MINGSFDLPYGVHPAHDNIFTAHGWSPWWSDRKWPDQDQNVNRPIATPEYKAITLLDDAQRVLDGDSCQCLFVFGKLMQAGVFQRVPVAAGKRCTFGVAFETWCSQSDNPRVSDAELYLRVGIDKRGGTDWEADSIVWGNWVRGAPEYARTAISAVAECDEVTLWIHAWNKWAVRHNDCYLDAATFEVEGEQPPPPPPEPGDVLRVEVSGTLHIVNDSPGLLAKIRALLMGGV